MEEEEKIEKERGKSKESRSKEKTEDTSWMIRKNTHGVSREKGKKLSWTWVGSLIERWTGSDSVGRTEGLRQRVCVCMFAIEEE